MLIALAGCRAKQPVIATTVPIHESTKVEMEGIEVTGDSAYIRVPFEELSKGERTSGVTVSPDGLQLMWELNKGMLNIKSKKPPEVIHYPRTTITREIPVEVVREIEVNHLHWWQKALMWIGVCGLIYIVLREIKNAPRKL